MLPVPYITGMQFLKLQLVIDSLTFFLEVNSIYAGVNYKPQLQPVGRR